MYPLGQWKVGVPFNEEAILTNVSALALTISLIALLYTGLAASMCLYERLLIKVAHAKMAYFESTSIGQLLTLFSKVRME
jgi:hypothetical protein